MDLSRRSFLRGALAAPAVVAAASLMPVRAIERLLIPRLWGDGVHDDTAALQAVLDGRPYWYGGLLMRAPAGVVLMPPGALAFRLSQPVDFRSLLRRQAQPHHAGAALTLRNIRMIT